MGLDAPCSTSKWGFIVMMHVGIRETEKMLKEIRAWWYLPATPALGMLRKEASLGYNSKFQARLG
jgi:hypothetical protein